MVRRNVMATTIVTCFSSSHPILTLSYVIVLFCQVQVVLCVLCVVCVLSVLCILCVLCVQCVPLSNVTVIIINYTNAKSSSA